MINSKCQYKMIAVDIDGTLLNDKRELLATTKNMITKAVKMGTIFVLSTGRPLIGAEEVSQKLAFDLPVIAGNGAIIATSKTKKIIFKRDLPVDVARDIIKISKKYQASLAIWCGDELFFNTEDEHTIKYGNLASTRPTVLDNLQEIYKKEITKIIWFDSPERLISIQEEIRPLLGSRTNFFTSNPTYLEFVALGVSKANALKTIGDYYHIPLKEIIAVGDGFNDLAMIEVAGLGVAMSNAVKEIQEKADFVTSSNNEDGVGKVIKEFILKKTDNTGIDMIKLEEVLNKIKNSKKYSFYPLSFNMVDNGIIFMIKEERDYLISLGDVASLFSGDNLVIEGISGKKSPTNHGTAKILRKILPFTAPIPVLRRERSFGVGDRLGIASVGHIRTFKNYDCYPVLVQQSIRELTLTNRTYDDVLDCVSFAVLKENYHKGFGADGDHLKNPQEIEYALGMGFTMITLDCSDYINNDIPSNDDVVLDEAMKNRYLGKTFIVEDIDLRFNVKELQRSLSIYGKALDFAVLMYNTYLKDKQDIVDFEISIDETSTPTTPLQHYFVANELVLRGVKFATIAPRFCGEFQKGVDYIGDLHQFEQELEIHAAIARHFGYKLSIHSGSDKFSTFALIGKYTKGNFHVKTAGTNWLEAMEVVAKVDPVLYREVHKYALSVFEEAKKYYHVTTNLDNIPDVDKIPDDKLGDLFRQNDSRQLIHITYGLILNHQDDKNNYIFKDRLYQLWQENSELYATKIEKHISKHLDLLYSGFQK
ncbi:MAG: tagaturonate epimerase family protein [Bacilli bacterium]|nr:tagaturonate epimerase family protein [Bacilli bacterium]